MASGEDLERELARFRAALVRIRDINHGPDRASGEWRCLEAAAIAREALGGGEHPAMDPAELRAILARLGWSQRLAGDRLGLGERRMRGYAAGREPIPPAVAGFLRYLEAEAPGAA